MKRSELYERIWSTPASKVAEELGISGSRVAAICKRHSVPTPPRGHWAKSAVGKQLPRAPLPQPEADYELKIGRPQHKPSAWVAPGVLIRPGAEAADSHVAAQASDPGPPEQEKDPATRQRSTEPAGPSPKPSTAHVDMDLVRALAAELQSIRAIRELLQAVTARAVHTPSLDAKRVVSWAAAARARLDEHDPVSGLLRLIAP